MHLPISRDDFPIFQLKKDQEPLSFLDNASTSQKPQVVIDALTDFYAHHNANVHRGVYGLAEQATALYEDARATVASFVNAPSPTTIVFTSGTTDSINLVATAWGLATIKAHDEIVISELEHHANLIPWQTLARKTGAIIRFIPAKLDGTLNLDSLEDIITHKTKLVSFSPISHVFGTQHDCMKIIRAAHAVGAKIFIDAAQWAPHHTIDVQALNIDFLAFSGHKMFGPMGIGVLYTRLTDIAPYQTGGGMVVESTFSGQNRWHDMPYRLEAGTPPVADAVALAQALCYIQKKIDFNQLQRYEAQLIQTLTEGLALLPHVRLFGPLENPASHGHIRAFAIQGIHPHDIAAYCATKNICVRAGHHCAQAITKKLSVDVSVRVSVYAYTTTHEIERFIECVATSISVFK